MKAGRLDRRVTFQERTESQDALGAPSETWANIATNPTVWAQRLDLRGKEFFTAREVHSEVEAKFVMRYRADITTDMRIVCEGVTYAIVAPPIELGRRRGLEIMAKVQR